MLQWPTNNPHSNDPAQAASSYPSWAHRTNWDAEEMSTLCSSPLLALMYELLYADGRHARTLLNELGFTLITQALWGYIFLGSVKAKSTGHELVGGSSKTNWRWVGTCASMYCWWLKTSSLHLSGAGRQQKSLSAFAQKNDNVPAGGIYTETTFHTQAVRAWCTDPFWLFW